ncbi:MAG: hypothetical protein A3E87_09845 [Gammaproteobacteria bacterium RIFCSPHIGHO2_12_FULL_35_23]|nr:MAG: hypothetical protein A3E87_09845 [Gammaproteobacteria bacterium RIFCSPHIGHO2_12_FULL_35_23]
MGLKTHLTEIELPASFDKKSRDKSLSAAKKAAATKLSHASFWQTALEKNAADAVRFAISFGR